MTNIFDGNELSLESNRKKKMLRIWLILLSITLILTLTIFIIYTQQGYQTPLKTPLFILNFAILAVFLLPSYAFFTLKYSRLKAYVKMLKFLETGLKEENTVEFVGFVGDEMHDKVEMTPLYVMQFNPARNIYYERKLFVDIQKELPPFQKGDILKVQLQGGILISYEIIPRPAGEPTLMEKYNRMMLKDKEMLHDNVILDEETVANLKKKRKKK